MKVGGRASFILSIWSLGNGALANRDVEFEGRVVLPRVYRAHIVKLVNFCQSGGCEIQYLVVVLIEFPLFFLKTQNSIPFQCQT